MINFFLNKHIILSLLFLVLQQVIVASSTYFIAKLAESFTLGILSYSYLILFIVSLIIVYIPAYFMIINLDRAKYCTHKKYNDRFKDVFLGKPQLIPADKELKDNAITTLAQESIHTISSIIDSVFDIITLILNIILNVLVISWFLDSTLLLGYFIGIVLATAFIHFNQSKLGFVAEQDQKSRLNLAARLLDGWDNIVIYNQYNYRIYDKAVSESFQEAQKNSIKSESLRHISSSLGMLILMCPVLIVTAFIFNSSWEDSAKISVMIATLPRQVQLLQMCYSLVSYHTSFSILKAMFNGILNVLKPTIVELDKYIKKNEIYIQQTGEIFNPENLPAFGRITLIGDNGVGKSSTLLKIKQEKKEKAFYLPAKHNLYFEYKKENVHRGSTGQELIRQMKEIEERDKSVILLLDEWDAHLDSKNTTIINQQLDVLSQKKLIIDVRHM